MLLFLMCPWWMEYKDLSLYFQSEIKSISYFPISKVKLVLSMAKGLFKGLWQVMAIPLENAHLFIMIHMHKSSNLAALFC